MQEEYELLEKQKAALEAKVKMYFDVMEQQKLKIREFYEMQKHRTSSSINCITN